MKPDLPYPKALSRFPMIRQSLLAAFDNCSLSAHFDLEHRNGWAHPWQARGLTFHRFAGRALREMHAQQEGKIEVDVALAILNEVLRQADVDRECPVCGSTKIRKGVTKAGMRLCLSGRHRFETEIVNLPMAEIKDLVWVVKKWAHDNEWDVNHLVSIEDRLGARVSYPNPHGGYVERLLSGKLDAVFLDPVDPSHAVVLDWKDTWALPGPTDVSFEGYFQQRWYGWLVMRNYRSVQKVTLREFYVRYSEPREATIWRDDLDQIEGEFAAIAERFDRAFDEKLWTPTPGKWCSYCALPQRCPIVPDVRQAGRITDAEQAKRVAAQLVVGQEVSRQARAALQSWAERHGPVPVKDAKGKRFFGYRSVERVERPDREALLQAVREAGEFEAVNLDDLFVRKQGTRFEAFSPKAIEEEEQDNALIEQLQRTLQEAHAA
jgi:hypothetical protein